ncbi:MULTISPECIES: alpha/beta hydrolase [Cyanophyceae]|uniref:Dienelactone hydrolase n=1 Tax=Aphanothece cf. minutissima CCALA 015 TaxID=2107695 RepID=A0ABX5FA22_9CHRO|nr:MULTISPECIES: alpha/beta hydrolase [Cyanophyceae]MCP9796707.1 alpha/beta hydrolase [Cyanobium sp. Lug-B]MCP9934155.1 alpha/beta hydrolase [Cyanobium sp. Candia 9D4]PSB37481.1 dienelactone hydrolase [Aphanothece cf. minutissima CCALA 015]
MTSPLRQLTALLLGVGPLLAAAPVRALEEIQLTLPLLETAFTVQIRELKDQRTLLSGNSDLAELDRATNGAIGRRLVEAFQTPLPLPLKALAEQSVGSPLVNQVLLLISSVVLVEGVRQPLDSSQLAASLESSQAKGSLNLLEVLEALPGKSATVDLQRVVFAIDRLTSQQRLGNQLVASLPAAGISPALSQAGPLAVKRQELAIPVTHRPKPLQVVTIQPETGSNGRLVLISHGLWDDPESFEGWGRHLASHGYTVLLPRHPGSDKSQQQAMLSGQVPPPKPEDLRLRPMDMTSAIDAAAAGSLGLPAGLRTDAVVAMGQSYGATTVLQLAGARPSAALLKRFCDDVTNPARNVSWVLQCSFLSSADQAGLADPRVKAVVAVSPPMSLLFDQGSGRAMNGRVLLVSGSRDWVVPSGPEALRPMAMEARNAGGGHRLVLAKDGDHFNLRSHFADGGGALRGLLLAWTDGAFAAGAAVAPAPDAPSLLPPDGWGATEFPLVDITGSLRSLPLGPNQP